MNIPMKIKELFSKLSLEEMDEMIVELQKMADTKRNSPALSYLNTRWEEIQYQIWELSREPYIDDQVQIDVVWQICEEIIQSGKIKEESWETRKKILQQIIVNCYYSDYSVWDPIRDLSRALCLNQEELIYFVDLAFRLGDGLVQEDVAPLYLECGLPEKYYAYVESHLRKETKPYLELIGYYREKDTEKAAEIAELGMKNGAKDQTEMVILLLQRARAEGDEESYRKLMKSARLRQAIDLKKVQAAMEEQAKYAKRLSD